MYPFFVAHHHTFLGSLTELSEHVVTKHATIETPLKSIFEDDLVEKIEMVQNQR